MAHHAPQNLPPNTHLRKTAPLSRSTSHHNTPLLPFSTPPHPHPASWFDCKWEAKGGLGRRVVGWGGRWERGRIVSMCSPQEETDNTDGEVQYWMGESRPFSAHVPRHVFMEGGDKGCWFRLDGTTWRGGLSIRPLTRTVDSPSQTWVWPLPATLSQTLKGNRVQPLSESSYLRAAPANNFISLEERSCAHWRDCCSLTPSLLLAKCRSSGQWGEIKLLCKPEF